jgi:hypothetical protein
MVDTRRSNAYSTPSILRTRWRLREGMQLYALAVQGVGPWILLDLQGGDTTKGER